MGDTGEACLVTIDGIDFRIPEPTPWSSLWFPHKFKGSGLRYEIAVCIATGWVVGYNGPFECGRWPDLTIFRSRLKGLLGPGERVCADRGYKGDDCVRHPDWGSDDQKKLMGRARARHETVNGRISNWQALKQVFRH